MSVEGGSSDNGHAATMELQPASVSLLEQDWQQCVARIHLWVSWTYELCHRAYPASQQFAVVVDPLPFDLPSTPKTKPRSVTPTMMVMRPLYRTEVTVLQQQCHCVCEDWSRIRLVLDAPKASYDQSRYLQSRLSWSVFEGMVILIATSMKSWYHIPSHPTTPSSTKRDFWNGLRWGIHNNQLIANCIVHLNARVVNNGIVQHTYIGPNAVLWNCSRVLTPELSSPGNKQDPLPWMMQSMAITVGPETGGGRSLAVTGDNTMIDICRQLTAQAATPYRHESSTSVAYLHSKMPLWEWNVLEHDSVLCDTPTVQQVYLSPQSSIEAANMIRHAVLLPSASIRYGVTASNVLLQWDACIHDSSSVSDAFLMEQAHVGPHSTVSSAVLGPDVHISNGEVHSSVLGPSTNAHHQSLVISVLWPLGRGNVGYGAKVGSNHTGRLPDQEVTCGEGIFWGLGCMAVMPIDMLAAPYSIVAASTTLAPPQRITMPFSLVLGPRGGGTGPSSAMTTSCQICPGWVLQRSPYTLARAMIKMQRRQKAKRHKHYTGWSLYRPALIQNCVDARQALLAVTATKNTAPVKSAIYTSKEISGLGSNLLTESNRLAGIQAYTDCIQRYALHGLLCFLEDFMCRSGIENAAMIPYSELCTLILAELPLSNTATVTARAPVITTQSPTWGVFPWDESSTPSSSWTSSSSSQSLSNHEWNYQKSLLRDEFPSSSLSSFISFDTLLITNAPSNSTADAPVDAVALVNNWIHYCLYHQLRSLEGKYAAAVYDCKKRDDARGRHIIPSYEAAHISADHDIVVLAVQDDAAQTMTRIQAVLNKIAPPGSADTTSPVQQSKM